MDPVMLMKAIGDIAPEYAERYAEPRKRRGRGLIAAAACAVLAAGFGLALYFIGRGMEPGHEAAGNTEPAITAAPTETASGQPTEAPTEEPTEEPLPEVECYFLSGVNGVTALIFDLPRGDISAWLKTFVIEDAPKEVTVTFDGVEYTGTYKQSYYGKNRHTLSHSYSFDNKGESSPFTIDAVTGELVHIAFGNSSFLREESLLPDIDNIDELAMNIANRYASLFIEELEDYEVFGPEIVNAVDLHPDFEPFNKYTYEYVRVLNGEKTTDALEVRIDSKGNLLGIFGGDIGVYDRLAEEGAKFEGIDLVAYMRPIFDEAYKGNTSDPEIRNVLYALTPDNEVVLMFEAYITLSDGMAAGGSFMLK